MDGDRERDWAAQLAAAAAWWREAGVEHAFADEPREWLACASSAPAESAPAAPDPSPSTPRRPPPAPRIGGDRAKWPGELAQFADWWLTEPSLDPVPGAHRVLPAGPAGAALMVLVAQPEAEDRATLLAGPQGRLLDAMLAAFGLDRAQAYLASVVPRPTPLIDWPALAAKGMGEVVKHHIALVAPHRLLVFGRGSVSTLLGHDPAQGAPILSELNHEGGSVPVAFAPALETLLERPALKAGVWTRWLDWTGTA